MIFICCYYKISFLMENFYTPLPHIGHFFKSRKIKMFNPNLVTNNFNLKPTHFSAKNIYNDFPDYL